MPLVWTRLKKVIPLLAVTCKSPSMWRHKIEHGGKRQRACIPKVFVCFLFLLFKKKDYYHLHLLSTTFSLQSSDITQVKRDVYKNMASIKLVSKRFFPIFVLDLLLSEKKTKLEVILKLYLNRLSPTIWRKFISKTFLTFRENQQAKEEFVSVDNVACMSKIYENIIYLPAISTMVLERKEID